MTIFVEKIAIRHWFFNLWPRLVLKKIASGFKPVEVYFFHVSNKALRLFQLCGALTGFTIDRLDFRMLDVRDEKGDLLGVSLRYNDLLEFQGITQNDLNLSAPSNEKYLSPYLLKALAYEYRNPIYLIRIVQWWVSKEKREETPTLYLVEKDLKDSLRTYARKYNVSLAWVPWTGSLKTFFQNNDNPWLFGMLRQRRDKWLLFKKNQALLGTKRFHEVTWSGEKSTPRLAVEYYGQLNLARPDLQSDLFFLNTSNVNPKQTTVLFGLPKDPIDQSKMKEMASLGVEALAIHPQATAIPQVPVYIPAPPKNKTPPLVQGQPWLKKKIGAFHMEKERWVHLFRQKNIKLFSTWYKFNEGHCAISEAMDEVGGAMTVYQRALVYKPCPLTTVGADVYFSFSNQDFDLEEKSGSKIQTMVAVGFMGDHRFSLMQPQADEVRKSLLSHGAKKILAFFDENSRSDDKWFTGHDLQRVGYKFLLEKVLEEPWFGLVIKPKVPGTLRKRLGPVAELLEAAEKTGRCVVLEGGKIHGSTPPAFAALAADAALHNCLAAGSAGFEAALTGKPTLLIDGEGWSDSPLYKLGKDQVGFKEWDVMWDKLSRHWKTPLNGFGDWSPLLNELDPYHDGKAAHRMGTYMEDLLDGFNQGLKKNEVLERAAEKFASTWGRDKIKTVGAGQ